MNIDGEKLLADLEHKVESRLSRIKSILRARVGGRVDVCKGIIDEIDVITELIDLIESGDYTTKDGQS